MRELTIQIRFTSHCLGNVNRNRGFEMPRDGAGRVIFLATKHRENMRAAAMVLGHYQEVNAIRWDMAVDGRISPGWQRRYKTTANGQKRRFAQHQAFDAGTIIGINCVVPSAISDEQMWQLMQHAGDFYGLSPYKPEDGWGRYTVMSIHRRRYRPDDEPTTTTEGTR